MKRFVLIGLAAVAMCVGCKDLKDQQHKSVIGNSDTKLFYKNAPAIAEKIPKDKQVFFKSSDEASNAGYKDSQEGASNPGE